MNKLLTLVEIIAVVCGFYFLLVQVVLPLIYKEKPFPYFREKEKVKEAILEVSEEEEIFKLEQKLKEKKSKLEEKRNAS